MKKALTVFIVVLSILSFSAFKDVPVNHWAYDSVSELSKLGIISGMPDGTFQGNQPMTRYQVAVALYRMMNYLQEKIDKAISNSSNVNNIREQILTLSDIVSTAMNKIEDLASLKSDLQAVSTDVSELKTSLVNTKNDVKSLSIDIASLENKILENTNKINELYGGGLGNKVDRSEFEKFVSDLTVLTNKINNFESNLSSLSNEVKDISESLTELNNRVDDLENLKDKIASLDEYVNASNKAFESRLQNLADIAVNSSEEVKSYLAETDAKFKKYDEQIQNLNIKLDKVDELSDEVKTLSLKINDIENNSNSSTEEVNNNLKELEKSTSSLKTITIFSLLLSVISSGLAVYILLTSQQ